MRFLLVCLSLLSLFQSIFAQSKPVSPEKPKSSLAAIEKKIAVVFKDQHWFEAANFPWQSEFSKIGKTPDSKTVLAFCKKAFRFNCSEAVLADIKTPRQLADQLFEILNNGVYFYEKTNFEGSAFTLYAPLGKLTDLSLDIKYLNGSCIKPAGYESKIEFGTNIFVKFGSTSAQWDAPNLAQKVPAEVLTRKSVKVRLMRE